MSVSILIGDCRESMAAMEADSIDSCVTDPPYHLTSIVKRFGADNAAPAKVGKTGAYARASKGFMGQTWDGGDVAFQPETWAAVFRVLKPGAHLVAFSAPRTYGRMQVAIEAAGFEVRDGLLDVIAADDPVRLFVQSLSDEQARAFFRCIEDSQFGGFLAWVFGSGFPKSHNQPGGWGTALKPAFEPIILARKPLIGTVAGNIALHGTGALNIDGCRIEGETIETTNGSVNQVYGDLTYNAGEPWKSHSLGRWPANIIHDGSDEVLAAFPEQVSGSRAEGVRTGIGYHSSAKGDGGPPIEGSSGSAARFFYCAKATTDERGQGNNHPTVKPIDLMRWLCRLVTPVGGTVLDPFAGSGSTLIAADAEQFNAIGCELSPDYAAIAERRVRDSAGLFAEVLAA